MEDLENGNVTRKELIQEIKTDMQSLISGMLKDVPEDSPNRAIISKTAEMLSNDKAMDEYVTKMDNSITKEKKRILGNKHEKKILAQEAFDEHGYADKEDLNRLALRNAVINSPFAKSSEEISKNEKNEAGNFWKKAAEFLNEIGATSFANACVKRHEKIQFKASHESVHKTKLPMLKMALLKSDKAEKMLHNSNSPRVNKTADKKREGR